MAHLLRHPGKGARLGEAGRDHVWEGFLITRRLADHLRLVAGLAA